MNLLSRNSMIYVYANIILLVFANQVFALGITHTNAYSNIINATGVNTAQNVIFSPENAITPFNPALGTLTDVEIRIYGDIVYSGIAGANWIPDAHGTPMPVPYSLDAEYSLAIDGLGGDYFSLDTPVKIEKTFPIPGNLGGIPIAGISSFSFTFDYDELINQIFWGPYDASCSGCNGYTPPLSMAGGLDGFIDDGFLIDQLNFNYSLSFTRIGQTIPSVTSLTATSNIFIQSSYIFTPVPVPAAIWLFGSGIIGLVGLAKRKART